MVRNNYSALVKEVEDIADDSGLKDYHAFVYWFIENMVQDPSRQKILNCICDGTHDKGIDAVLIEDIERKIIVIQSKYEREGEKVQIKESEIKLLASVTNYLKSRKSLDAILTKANPSARRLLNEAYESLKKGFSLELVFITTHRNAPQVSALISDVLGFKQGGFFVYHYSEILQLFAEK